MVRYRWKGIPGSAAKKQMRGIFTMTIQRNIDGDRVELTLTGRLDTITAPQLENELNAILPGITDLQFDLTDLSYISSAGLRVLLSAQKRMNRQGEMLIRGANADLMEVFEVTGFVDILNIEGA